MLDSYLFKVGDVVVRLVNVLHVDVGQFEVELCTEALQKYLGFVKIIKDDPQITDDSKITMKNNLMALHRASLCLRARQSILP